MYCIFPFEPYFLEERFPSGSERVILTLFGDKNEVAGEGDFNRYGLSEKQTISFRLNYPQIRPYGQVLGEFKRVKTRFEEAGWKLSFPVDAPFSGSNIFGMVNTTDSEYRGVGQDFPPEEAGEGFNAAAGFFLVFERVEERPPSFTQEEIDLLRQLGEELAQQILGHKVVLEGF